MVIGAQDGPVVLVGHSYGGAVIAEAGTHDNVSALVYIAGFMPDGGESVNKLIADPPPGALVPPILPPQDGFLLLDREEFPGSFAGDLPEQQAAFMADPQVPWGAGRPRRTGHRAGVEGQAQLVLAHDRGSDDSTAGAARHGGPGRLDGGRGCGEPCRLPLASGRGGRFDRTGRDRGVGAALTASDWSRRDPGRPPHGSRWYARDPFRGHRDEGPKVPRRDRGKTERDSSNGRV